MMALLPVEYCRNLSPWKPWRELETSFGRLFDDLVRDFETPDTQWTPAVDLRETDTAYIIETDLPGIKKEDIDLRIQDDVVTIKGERKHEETTDKEGYHRYERRYGSFQRSFRIPKGIDVDNVEATYKDGVLHVTLPKREDVRPKQIDVKVS